MVNHQETRYQVAYDRYIAEYRICYGLVSYAGQAVAGLGEQRIVAMADPLSYAEGEPQALDYATLQRSNETCQEARRNLIAYQTLHAPGLTGNEGTL